MGKKTGMKTDESPRKVLQAELRVYYGPSQEKVLYGFSVDMSSGGLFLKTDSEFSIDDKVLLSFTLPDVKKIINCEARVAWLNTKGSLQKPALPAGIGLQFINLPQEYSNSIQSLLQHDAVVPMDIESE